MSPAQSALALLLLVAAPALDAQAAAGASDAALAAETAGVDAWRRQRVDSLTGDEGWLTLAGLFWLRPGANSFGRDPGNDLVLERAALAPHAGSFTLEAGAVRFTARPDSHVTHDGTPVGELAMAADTTGHPTVLASGTLRFYVIERAGHLGVRVRDLADPHRLDFAGLHYFPVSLDWVFDARFEPYQPTRRIRIVNILGMEEDLVSPGAVVFEKDGREWRLDTVLEAPEASELFIMFADATSGHATYGGGRFLYVKPPVEGRVRLDFNEAYNPPCAFNDFATCPLPPAQNRLALPVTAGELAYARPH